MRPWTLELRADAVVQGCREEGAAGSAGPLAETPRARGNRLIRVERAGGDQPHLPVQREVGGDGARLMLAREDRGERRGEFCERAAAGPGCSMYREASST